MLLSRIISALIFIPFCFYCLFYSQAGLLLLIGTIVVMGLIEFYNLVDHSNEKPFKVLGLVFALILLERAYQSPERYYFFSFWLMLPWLAASGLTILVPGLRGYVRGILTTLGGIIYLGYLLSHLLLINNFQAGNYYLLLLFVIVWVTDSAAYGVGVHFGRHKLMPTVSPKKTVEGFLGGLAGAIVISTIFSLTFKELSLSIGQALTLGLLLGIFGQVGDLIESKLKRLAEVKDSGDFASGHGGVLDVFDSLILAGPVMYGYLILFK